MQLGQVATAAVCCKRGQPQPLSHNEVWQQQQLILRLAVAQAAVEMDSYSGDLATCIHLCHMHGSSGLHVAVPYNLPYAVPWSLLHADMTSGCESYLERMAVCM